MTIDPNWQRWVCLSIQNHFATSDHIISWQTYIDNPQAYPDKVPLWIENPNYDKSQVDKNLEIRIGGPYFTRVSNKTWKLRVIVNALLETEMNMANLMFQQEVLGKIQESFSTIPLRMYGPYETDTQGQIACMDVYGEIITIDFSQEAAEEKRQIAYIEAEYRTELRRLN